MLVNRSISNPFDDEACISGGMVASRASGGIVPLWTGEVVDTCPAVLTRGVSVDDRAFMGLVSPQLAVSRLEGVSG